MEAIRSIEPLELHAYAQKVLVPGQRRWAAVISSAVLHGLVLAIGLVLALNPGGRPRDSGDPGRSIRVSLLTADSTSSASSSATRPTMTLDPAQPGSTPGEHGADADASTKAALGNDTTISESGTGGAGSDAEAAGPDLARLILRCLPTGMQAELSGVELTLRLNLQGQLQAPPAAVGISASQAKIADRLVQAALQCGPYPMEFASRDITLTSWDKASEPR